MKMKPSVFSMAMRRKATAEVLFATVLPSPLLLVTEYFAIKTCLKTAQAC
jgi:hypothetical protein